MRTMTPEDARSNPADDPLREARGLPEADSKQALRERAEALAGESVGAITENLEALSPEAARRALHELRVHQIELKMQNAELRRTQEELEGSRARYFDLYDLAPVGYFTLDEWGLILEANLTAAKLLGVARSALVKWPLSRFILPEDQNIHYQHFKPLLGTGVPQSWELRLLRKDAAPFWARVEATTAQDADGASVCRAVVSDITERKRSEEQMLQTQKLESIGLLAGGIAHDFNNLLVGVIGNASLARDILPTGCSAFELLDRVVESGEQAAFLTRQMLAYSGKGRFVIELMNLSTLIPQMSGLVQPSISKKIVLEFELDPDLLPIRADRGQVQQVFMNLVLNAAEAIGSDAGLILVKTGRQDVDEQNLRHDPGGAELRPGPYVYLEVRDTGCGMDEATKARIFDPFFSTKFMGRGLGLAAVGGIVRAHEGSIQVTSRPGKGTCFTVLFPVADRAAVTASAAPAGSLLGAGTVLVVDDQEVVRKVVKRGLERYGYQVLLADSGPAAMDVCKRHPGEIALVVLDLSMPGMSGEETLPELRKIRPGIRVMVSSGYSEDETMRFFQGYPVSGFIQKPYTAAQLAEKVKAAVGQSRQPSLNAAL